MIFRIFLCMIIVFSSTRCLALRAKKQNDVVLISHDREEVFLPRSIIHLSERLNRLVEEPADMWVPRYVQISIADLSGKQLVLIITLMKMVAWGKMPVHDALDMLLAGKKIHNPGDFAALVFGARYFQLTVFNEVYRWSIKQLLLCMPRDLDSDELKPWLARTIINELKLPPYNDVQMLHDWARVAYQNKK